MNIRKNRLFKSSGQTAQRLAKEAFKNGHRIEEERMFPIYVVVSRHDKNDDIIIIHPAYPVMPFQNSHNNQNKPPSDKSSRPVDKPIRPIDRTTKGKNNPEDSQSSKL
jgi:hypothetical protein